MGDAIGKLFGAKKPEGPTEAEKAMQRDRETRANRDEGEEDKKLALVSRAQSLRRSLSYQGDGKQTTGG